MFIKNFACNLLDGLVQQNDHASRQTSILLNACVEEEEVGDEPAQPRDQFPALSPPQSQRAYAN